jgi:hypothetical protein
MSDSIPPNEFYSGAGGEVDECSLLLRFFGDDLDPETITALLGVDPTDACRKGDPVRASHTGRWLLDCERTSDTPDSQIKLLMSDLTDELDVWQRLAASFSAEIKCHLFLKRWTRGTIFSTESLTLLTERGLRLHVEVYTPFPPTHEPDL